MKNIIKILSLILFLSTSSKILSQNQLTCLNRKDILHQKTLFKEVDLKLNLKKNYSESSNKRLGCAVLIVAGIAFITASALESYDDKINQSSEIKASHQIMMSVGVGFTLGGTIGLMTLKNK